MIALSVYFLFTLFVYYSINRPFLSLKCHQDAGWHSYWAAFRNRGVGLDSQLNVLMGCIRMASIYYFVLLFKIFGLKDPERISRTAFMVLNYLAHILLFFSMKILFPDNNVILFLVPLIYLIYSSNPYWGIHYETSERTVIVINAFVFFLISCGVFSLNEYFYLVALFIMFLTSLFFKYTMLIEYFGLWVFFLFNSNNNAEFIASSLIIFLTALGAFILFLKHKGLLTKKNFSGLIGYSKRQGAMSDANKYIKKNQKDAAEVLRDKFKIKTAIEPLSRLALFMRNNNMLWNSLLAFRRFLLFGAPICKSSAFMLFTSLAGIILTPHFNIEPILLLWICGIALGIVIQGSYILLHFTPLIFPLSVLSGLGIFKLLSQTNIHALLIILFILSALLFNDSKRRLPFFFSKNAAPHEYLLWPSTCRDMIDKNIAVYELIDYIKNNTAEDDYIFVWGCVPQVYVLCQRKSPIGWLSALDEHIRPVLPEWKKVTLYNLYRCRPRYIIDFLNTINLEIINAITGLRYSFDKTLFDNKFHIYKLDSITSNVFKEDDRLIESL